MGTDTRRGGTERGKRAGKPQTAAASPLRARLYALLLALLCAAVYTLSYLVLLIPLRALTARAPDFAAYVLQALLPGMAGSALCLPLCRALGIPMRLTAAAYVVLSAAVVLLYLFQLFLLGGDTEAGRWTLLFFARFLFPPLLTGGVPAWVLYLRARRSESGGT